MSSLLSLQEEFLRDKGMEMSQFFSAYHDLVSVITSLQSALPTPQAETLVSTHIQLSQPSVQILTPSPLTPSTPGSKARARKAATLESKR